MSGFGHLCRDTWPHCLELLVVSSLLFLLFVVGGDGGFCLFVCLFYFVYTSLGVLQFAHLLDKLISSVSKSAEMNALSFPFVSRD